MTLTSLESIVAILNQYQVRYLIVGGVAVAAHGYGRVTFDVDLVVQLSPKNVEQAIRALEALDYKPVVPVNAVDFADPEIRKEWIAEKNMVVFSLRSAQHPETPVDLFVSEPFDFDVEYDRALVGQLAPGQEVRFVCLETLIRMKQATGRPKDEEDVRQLQLIIEEPDEEA